MFLKSSDSQCYLIQSLLSGFVIIIFQMGNSEKLSNVNKVTQLEKKQNKNSKPDLSNPKACVPTVKNHFFLVCSSYK